MARAKGKSPVKRRLTRQGALDGEQSEQDADAIVGLPPETRLLLAFDEAALEGLQDHVPPVLDENAATRIQVPAFTLHPPPLPRLRHVPVLSMDNSVYERLHRHPEMLEKRAKKQELERLSSERNKLRLNLEKLKSTYTSALHSAPQEVLRKQQTKIKEAEELLHRYDELLEPIPSALPTATSVTSNLEEGITTRHGKRLKAPLAKAPSTRHADGQRSLTPQASAIPSVVPGIEVPKPSKPARPSKRRKVAADEPPEPIGAAGTSIVHPKAAVPAPPIQEARPKRPAKKKDALSQPAGVPEATAPESGGSKSKREVQDPPPVSSSPRDTRLRRKEHPEPSPDSQMIQETLAPPSPGRDLKRLVEPEEPVEEAPDERRPHRKRKLAPRGLDKTPALASPRTDRPKVQDTVPDSQASSHVVIPDSQESRPKGPQEESVPDSQPEALEGTEVSESPPFRGRKGSKPKVLSPPASSEQGRRRSGRPTSAKASYAEQDSVDETDEDAYLPSEATGEEKPRRRRSTRTTRVQLDVPPDASSTISDSQPSHRTRSSKGASSQEVPEAGDIPDTPRRPPIAPSSPLSDLSSSPGPKPPAGRLSDVEAVPSPPASPTQTAHLATSSSKRRKTYKRSTGARKKTGAHPTRGVTTVEEEEPEDVAVEAEAEAPQGELPLDRHALPAPATPARRIGPPNGSPSSTVRSSGRDRRTPRRFSPEA